ncbi:MAG: beta-ketoacyl-ACP synthase II [Anaerolineae bacterium]|nr:beta-ketoacyl-ACP synthase II [Anaerolineae bacterium]
MRRVVITGIGIISPLGHTAQETWEAIKDGRSGIGPITLLDVSNFEVKHAAEVKNFDPTTVLDRREARRQDRFEWFANAAATEALRHSGLEITEENNSRIGVAISSGIGGLATLEEQVKLLQAKGPRSLSPFGIPRIMGNGAAGSVSILNKIHGPSFSVASACASGADGIGTATLLIRSGIVDVMIAGGSEAPITGLGIGGFERIGAASLRDSETPSPFSHDRDGLIVGEGAGILILENLEHARARKADILGEIIGYGASADAHHITAPTEDGSGSAKAIKYALENAGISPGNVDYINAHGTGTQLNDEAETNSIKLALGTHAYNIPISSTKSMTGHIMGATGAIEAIFCIQAIRDGIIPPTINYRGPDPVCDLDYVPNKAREKEITIAMSNSFGFGGHNAVLIFKAFKN